MQDLVDSYDLAGKTDREVWPQDNKSETKFSNKNIEEKQTSDSPAQINFVPPESLFEDASTEEKKELLEMYFNKLKEIVEITHR